MDEYNGWSNYPTWCVYIWLCNEYGIYKLSRGYANKGVEGEEYIKELVKAMVGSHSIKGLASDLMTWALNQVNWREIREAFLEE